MNVEPFKKTILIVDDEPDIRDLLKDFLENDGYHVILSPSGSGTMKLVEEQVPDLVILDLLLPGEHGLDLVAGIKEKFFIPTIIISGVYRLQEILPQLETIMVDGFLEKPINFVNLRGLVNKILR